MKFFKRNPFGHILFIKRFLIQILGAISHGRYRRFNSLQVEGMDIIRQLPDKKVLFISNHQTYFADVAAMFHVFNAALKGRDNTLKNIFYLWKPKLNVYFVAAGETMRDGLLPKIFAYTGAVSIDRTWRSAGKDIKRQVKFDDVTNIGKAIDDGWVITFPQGTTRSFKPIRRGTAHLIKKYKPIVVPIVIDGFRRSFDRKGLYIKKRNILQSLVIKDPLEIDYENESIESIVEKVEYAIEQHPSFLKVLTPEQINDQKELEERRYFQGFDSPRKHLDDKIKNKKAEKKKKKTKQKQNKTKKK